MASNQIQPETDLEAKLLQELKQQTDVTARYVILIVRVALGVMAFVTEMEWLVIGCPCVDELTLLG